MDVTLSNRIQQYISVLDATGPRYNDGRPMETHHLDEIRPNQKYVRIYSDNGTQRMVVAFIDVKTGDVLKAQTWKAPVKDPRFNLLDDESRKTLLFAVMTGISGYLYVDGAKMARQRYSDHQGRVGGLNF